MSEKVKVYYGQCDNHHFVLLDPTAPVFEKAPPSASHSTNCLGCGHNYRVTLKTIKSGWAEREDLNHGFSLVEPTPK